MTVPPWGIQAGHCYLTLNRQVARVVKLLPYGGVHYQFRDATLARVFGWHSGTTTISTFVLMVECPVPCDWTTETQE
jgi:hypothetical protein